MKNLPVSTRSTSNNVSVNVTPSDFSFFEVTQVIGKETTFELDFPRRIMFSHKSGDRLRFSGKK